MSHYFSENSEAFSDPQKISIDLLGRSFDLWTDQGVFSKDQLDVGSRALLEILLGNYRDRLDAHQQALDLGCGYGAMTLLIAAFAPQLQWSAIDVNRRAILCLERNAKAHKRHVQTYVNSSPTALPQEYDLIITNPPIRIGKKALYKLLEEAYNKLSRGGSMWLVIGKKQGASSMEKYLETLATSTPSDTLEKGVSTVYKRGHQSGFVVYELTKQGEDHESL